MRGRFTNAKFLNVRPLALHHPCHLPDGLAVAVGVAAILVVATGVAVEGASEMELGDAAAPVGPDAGLAKEGVGLGTAPSGTG